MSNRIPSTPRRQSQSETDTEMSSFVSSSSSGEQGSDSEDGSEKSAQAPVMKTRQASVASPTTPATHNTNSSAPLQTTMTSSSPTEKNRQTGDQKRARYGQARNLPAYQRDTDIKKIKTVERGGAADLVQAPKPDDRWSQPAKVMITNDQPIVRPPWESDTSELDMGGRYMGDADVLALANFLRDNTTLTTLRLGFCSISTAGARALAEALKVNTTLKTLVLYHNDIGAEGGVALSEALLVNTTLTTLDLSHNKIRAEDAVALAEALLGNTTLTTLYLGRNRIGSKGAVALANALKVNATLTELNLSSNWIDIEGALALANALKVNATLTELYLPSNWIDIEGALALAKALKFNTTLTILMLDSYIDSTVKKDIDDLLERNKRLKLQPHAEASLDLIFKHSPVLREVGMPTDVIPVLAQQLSTEVLAVFEQEWEEAFSAPPPSITTTTTTTTTDSTIPTTLVTPPAPTATSMASVTPVSTQPIATAAEINALLADANPVVALSRWIDGHANPIVALNWVDSANGYTLLHYAVVAQQGEVVRSLLARGIDRTKADQNNQTAAQLAQQRADSSSSQAVAAIAALLR